MNGIGEAGYAALRDAVNLARDEDIQYVANLRIRLGQVGHSDKAIQEALLFMAAEERKS